LLYSTKCSLYLYVMLLYTELHVTAERHVYISHSAGHNVLNRKYLTLYTVSSLLAIFFMTIF